MTSPTKSSPTANTKPNRLPAPTLFVGPPSRNASQLSVSRQQADPTTKGSRAPLERQKSALSRPYNPDQNGNGKQAARDGNPIPTLKRPSDKSIDAKWREMQSTLNEVELTAQSSTHVFGASHAAALDELRKAQIDLAKAWGRGNDKANASGDDAQELNVNRFQGAEDLAADRARGSRKRADTASSTASTALSDESARTDNTTQTGRSQLEDETAQDIKLAGERRAANEAYFKKVDEGVKEVVAKLEVVAEAMRSVESESRSLWSASERASGESGSGQEAAASAA